MVMKYDGIEFEKIDELVAYKEQQQRRGNKTEVTTEFKFPTIEYPQHKDNKQEFVKKFVDYSQQTIPKSHGNLYWKFKNSTEARMIWEKAKGQIPHGYVVFHIDGNSTNNDINNLTLITRQELQQKLVEKWRQNGFKKKPRQPKQTTPKQLLYNNNNSYWKENEMTYLKTFLQMNVGKRISLKTKQELSRQLGRTTASIGFMLSRLRLELNLPPLTKSKQ